MKIAHIVWTDPICHPAWGNGKITGVLKLEAIYHGGGDETFISEGDYDTVKGEVRLKVGQINMVGIAGIYLLAVAEIEGYEP